jgi:SPX domain protein involved in polyphosphate accumulation
LRDKKNIEKLMGEIVSVIGDQKMQPFFISVYNLRKKIRIKNKNKKIT